MDARDIEIRNRTYQQFVEVGRAATVEEIARIEGCNPDEIHSSWKRLHSQHALVLNPAGNELRMVNPFSAVPTAYRVQASGRGWYANCAWDAFGICAALHCDGRIETSCPDCLEPLAIEVRGKEPDRKELLFHCLVSAARWWDDIIFT